MSAKDRSQAGSREVEEGGRMLLDFDKLGKVARCGEDLVPVAVQDEASKEVLLVAYANQAALEHTLEHKVAAFWSTSREELWVKGATSGEFLDLVEVRVNCEQNSLLFLVRLRGAGACHTRGEDGKARLGCFYRRLEGDELKPV
jgi:phosphoribosyl-AMP cyclohydrolase